MRPGHCSIFVLRKEKKTPLFSFTVQQDCLISFEENFILLFRGHPESIFLSLYLALGSGHVMNWYVNTSAQAWSISSSWCVRIFMGYTYCFQV